MNNREEMSTNMLWSFFVKYYIIIIFWFLFILFFVAWNEEKMMMINFIIFLFLLFFFIYVMFFNFVEDRISFIFSSLNELMFFKMSLLKIFSDKLLLVLKMLKSMAFGLMSVNFFYVSLYSIMKFNYTLKVFSKYFINKMINFYTLKIYWNFVFYFMNEYYYLCLFTKYFYMVSKLTKNLK